MSVRVVARIRPLLKQELDKDIIVRPAHSHQDVAADAQPTIVKIPNPKNPSEDFSFHFNGVYDQSVTQQGLFDGEVAPTVKHLFGGFDVTLFAYGVTGTGKTHTMRGGKSMADRGVIPRLLSSIYRKGRKIEKDTDGETKVEVSLSYYEIYCDKVFDLFERPERRTPSGLPIRDYNGKTIVAGLTERPCTTLKDFEHLYDEANINRSTSATKVSQIELNTIDQLAKKDSVKLNAHSSRSHAVLCVKISQVSSEKTIVSCASAIDLAGSEDNRRTDNNKERLIESSAINKSLFVLAQCVEAIGKKQSRIPYRESKMTRILGLGQNNGLTVMILNLAPVKSYHLDTLSSLTVASRTKKIEVREIENEPIYKMQVKAKAPTMNTNVPREPLRPIPTAANIGLRTGLTVGLKPPKAFSVFEEKSAAHLTSAMKRPSDPSFGPGRPTKISRPSSIVARMTKPAQSEMSRANLEELVNRMIEEKLASKALAEPEKPQAVLSEEMQKRLDALEERVGKSEDERSEGLQYLLMAKQHQARGEDASALRMYQLAEPFFPSNEKLAQKMTMLQARLEGKRLSRSPGLATRPIKSRAPLPREIPDQLDGDYEDDGNLSPPEDDQSFTVKPRARQPPPRRIKAHIFRDRSVSDGELTPRSQRLLEIVNTRDMTQIKLLKGVGSKRAETIVTCLCALDEDEDGTMLIKDLEQLGSLKGVGARTVESMRLGISV